MASFEAKKRHGHDFEVLRRKYDRGDCEQSNHGQVDPSHDGLSRLAGIAKWLLTPDSHHRTRGGAGKVGPGSNIRWAGQGPCGLRRGDPPRPPLPISGVRISRLASSQMGKSLLFTPEGE
jgi:hypothetical protein